MAAVKQKLGIRTLPARSANACISYVQTTRRTSSFSDLNKSTVFKSKITKNSNKHHQTSLSSNYSNSKITNQSEDEENLVQTIDSIKPRDFAPVALSPEPTNSKNSPKTENESVEKTDVKNIDKTDDESVGKNDDKKVNKTDGENVNKNDSEHVDKSDNKNVFKTDSGNVDKNDDKKANETDSENVDKTANERVDKNDDKNVNRTDGENVVNTNIEKAGVKTIETSCCTNLNNTTNEKPNDNSLAKTNNDQFETALNESDDETKFNCLNKQDEKYVEKAKSKSVKNACANNTKSISSNRKTTLKRNCEEKSTRTVNKRKRFKRKRLISTSSQDSSEAANDRKSLDKESKLKTNDGSSRKIGGDKRKPIRPMRRVERVKEDLYTIEKVISEMQNKIQNLERKSCLDEKKIETFKKALIEQRENDIKLLMDEKENEVR